MFQSRVLHDPACVLHDPSILQYIYPGGGGEGDGSGGGGEVGEGDGGAGAGEGETGSAMAMAGSVMEAAATAAVDGGGGGGDGDGRWVGLVVAGTREAAALRRVVKCHPSKEGVVRCLRAYPGCRRREQTVSLTPRGALASRGQASARCSRSMSRNRPP